MNRAVCLAKDAGHGRKAAAAVICVLAMGLAACSSPMPPWQPPPTTIRPAPAPSAPVTTLPLPPAVRPVQAPPPAMAPSAPPPAMDAEPPRAGMANPASTYCLQRGGQLEFSTRANGAEVGTCVSPGGDECEEWAFLRGSCTW
ncbi:putative hemolysin (plasmid) [Ralstonia sp. 25C]|uniref:putative hemolysin n=1 Tax=Ralstonia sp. 25C TaxID=3447363 RepID=UPI003F750CCF